MQQRGERCAQVVMRPVNLLRLEALIGASGIEAERARNKFADYLAFGQTPVLEGLR